jgi:hypothetical protein
MGSLLLASPFVQFYLLHLAVLGIATLWPRKGKHRERKTAHEQVAGTD